MKKIIIGILIVVNIILAVILGSNIGKYNKQISMINEDDKKYIQKIESLKQEQNDITNQIANQNKVLEDINKSIEEKNKIMNGTAKYIMKINISQTHYTLSISEHLKDAMNDIDIYIEVSEEFYNKYNVGDIVADDFRVGSAIFKGSYGSWKVKVSEKQIV